VPATLEVVVGDITRQDVDAIVNAANETLLGGGGVDGAIHRAGGPAILDECRRLGGCPTGQARVTGAGRLATQYVVHAVGPVWRGGGEGEDALLEACHRSAIALAGARGCASVAFPAISTGAYGFPIRRAAGIALRTVQEAAAEWPGLRLVRFVCFTEPDAEVFRAALAELG
jgi:O-acetyl-ADP-ribose deacetylase (regulator of RNase III)